jgi:hypothetical protein
MFLSLFIIRQLAETVGERDIGLVIGDLASRGAERRVVPPIGEVRNRNSEQRAECNVPHVVTVIFAARDGYH